MWRLVWLEEWFLNFATSQREEPQQTRMFDDIRKPPTGSSHDLLRQRMGSTKIVGTKTKENANIRVQSVHTCPDN